MTLRSTEIQYVIWKLLSILLYKVEKIPNKHISSYFFSEAKEFLDPCLKKLFTLAATAKVCGLCFFLEHLVLNLLMPKSNII